MRTALPPSTIIFDDTETSSLTYPPIYGSKRAVVENSPIGEKNHVNFEPWAHALNNILRNEPLKFNP